MDFVSLALAARTVLSRDGVCLAAVLVVFCHELVSQLRHLASMDGEQVILLALSLIDLSLAATFAVSGGLLAAMDWITARVDEAH